MVDQCPICRGPAKRDTLEYDDGSLSTIVDCEACEWRYHWQFDDRFLTVGNVTIAIPEATAVRQVRRLESLFRRRVRKCRRTYSRQHRRPWVPALPVRQIGVGNCRCTLLK